MNKAMNHSQVQTCPQCGSHCPADALLCGRGRKYFGAADDGHDGHSHDGHGHGGHGHHHGCEGHNK